MDFTVNNAIFASFFLFLFNNLSPTGKPASRGSSSVSDHLRRQLQPPEGWEGEVRSCQGGIGPDWYWSVQCQWGESAGKVVLFSSDFNYFFKIKIHVLHFFFIWLPIGCPGRAAGPEGGVVWALQGLGANWSNEGAAVGVCAATQGKLFSLITQNVFMF